MALVQAKCTNCGAILKVDDGKESAVCDSCGSSYIVEHAIHYYNITNHNYTPTYNTTPETDESAQPSEMLENDQLAVTGENALRSQNWQLAEKCFVKLMDEYPGDYRGPMGMFSLNANENYRGDPRSVLDSMRIYYKDALLLAPDEKKGEIQEAYERLMRRAKELEEQQARRAEERVQKEKAASEAAERAAQLAYGETYGRIFGEFEKKRKSELIFFITAAIFFLFLFLITQSGIRYLFAFCILIVLSGLGRFVQDGSSHLSPDARKAAKFKAESEASEAANKARNDAYWEYMKLPK